MKSKMLYVARNTLIYLSVFALISTLFVGLTPTKSFAKSFPVEIDGESTQILEIIKFTDEDVIYKTIEDGDIFLYEELIEGDIVTTNKFKIVNNQPDELVESFSTTTKLNEDTISVTQKDLLANKIISDTTVKILPKDYIIIDDPEISLSTTGKWVQVRGAGNRYAYYKYSNGGGKARELSYEKEVKS